MGNKNKRKAAQDAADGVPDGQIGEDEMRCIESLIVPRLTALGIIDGAISGGNPAHWTTVQLGGATVRATTAPPDFPGVTWDGSQAGVAPMERTISRAVVGTFNVGATLNSPRMHVELEVFNLTALVSDLPIAVAGTTRKGYAGFIAGNITRVSATTEPAADKVWNQLVWSAGAADAQANVRAVTVAVPGDQTVTVTLGTPAIGQLQQQVVLHICAWPRLEVIELTFSQGHVINNDTAADFDRLWQHGRAPNPPQCYTRNTAMTLAATLRVVRAPTDPENVVVRGTATIGGTAMTWTSAQIAVAPNAATVAFAAVAASAPLPNQVGFHQGAQINWEMSDPNGGWLSIGTTIHNVYVTLGNPIVADRVYWTLLHYSCVNGAGSAAAGAFTNAAFGTYTGRNLVRKRDNKPMTYWDPSSVARVNGNTMALLGSDSRRHLPGDQNGLPAPGGEEVAVGHCGSWAESFVDMLKIHGVANAFKINIKNQFPMARPAPPVTAAIMADAGFLVAAWNFAPPVAISGTTLTHRQWVTCTTGVHAPGQSNPTPPPAFYNHFVVWCTGTNTLYDPSYGNRFAGATVAAVLQAWEMHSISGLFADGAPPNAGYATAAVPAPARRLIFRYTNNNNELV
jgi:hypothetical protein